jgi:hypothetical protein
MPEFYVHMQLLRICRHQFAVNVEIMHLMLSQYIMQHVSAYTFLLGFLSRSLSFFKPILKLFYNNLGLVFHLSQPYKLRRILPGL